MTTSSLWHHAPINLLRHSLAVGKGGRRARLGRQSWSAWLEVDLLDRKSENRRDEQLTAFIASTSAVEATGFGDIGDLSSQSLPSSLSNATGWAADLHSATSFIFPKHLDRSQNLTPGRILIVEAAAPAQKKDSWIRSSNQRASLEIYIHRCTTV